MVRSLIRGLRGGLIRWPFLFVKINLISSASTIISLGFLPIQLSETFPIHNIAYLTTNNLLIGSIQSENCYRKQGAKIVRFIILRINLWKIKIKKVYILGNHSYKNSRKICNNKLNSELILRLNLKL